MTGIFSSAKTPALVEPEPTPTAADPAVEEARRKELLAAQKSKGRAATLLTGGDGDTSEAPVERKRLLGE